MQCLTLCFAVVAVSVVPCWSRPSGWSLPQHSLSSLYHPSSYPAQTEPIIPYHGPTAVPVVLPSGHLADTPEVAVAKTHHLAAVAQAKADKYYSGHSEYGYGGAYGYSGSHHGYGIPVVLPSGHIADTKEVAEAKSAHLIAVAKAKAAQHGYGESYGYDSHGFSGSYHGYGIPYVKADGHIADTHEVAVAKAAHMAAVSEENAKHLHDHHQYLLEDEDDGEYDQPEVLVGQLVHYHHEQVPVFIPHQVPYGNELWY